MGGRILFFHGDTALVDEENALTPATEPPAEPAAEETGERSPTPPMKKKRGTAWVGYIVLFAVAAVAVGGWFLLQELRSRQEGLGGQIGTKDQQLLEVTRQLNALQAELTTLHSQFASVQSQTTTEEAKIERMLGENSAQMNERIQLVRTDLGQTLQLIQRQLNVTRGDLAIADAEYMLGIANQKLHLVGDVKSVLAAMQAADQRLRESGDMGVVRVRQALADEIGTLKRMDAPDVVGLSARLLALESRARKAPLFLPHAGKEQAAPGQGGENGSDLLSGFKDLVTVRHSDRPVSEILTPVQAEALREVLLLKLETTRAALLRGDEAIYKASLASARDWLKEHFDPAAPVNQEIAAELDSMSAQRIQVEFPDISKSLSLLRNIEKLRLEAEDKLVGTARPAKAEPAAPPPEPPAAAEEPAPTPPVENPSTPTQETGVPQ